MDVLAIADAIAARYTAAVIGTPADCPAIRSSSARPPAQLGPLPAVLVFADSGSLDTGNGTRTGLGRYLVRLYLAEAIDLERLAGQAMAYAGAMLQAHLAAVQLGGLVALVLAGEWRIGVLPYAGQRYAGVEVVALATTTEPWSPTA